MPRLLPSTLCGQHSISLEPEWILRELNIEADSLSRQVDYDDYMVNPDIFAALDIVGAPHCQQVLYLQDTPSSSFLQSLALSLC